MRKIVYNNNVHKDNISQFKGVKQHGTDYQGFRQSHPRRTLFSHQVPGCPEDDQQEGRTDWRF